MESFVTPDEGPWYKQFWLWFLIVPILILMTGSFFLLYKSIVTHDGVVLDNHYKDGKGYILRTEEDQFARSINLKGELIWGENQLSIRLTGALAPLPEKLELVIAYPTKEVYDITLVLNHRGLGEYTVPFETLVEGRRVLQIHPLDTDQEWRLHFDGQVPPTSSMIELNPKQE